MNFEYVVIQIKMKIHVLHVFCVIRILSVVEVNTLRYKIDLHVIYTFVCPYSKFINITEKYLQTFFFFFRYIIRLLITDY